MQATLKGLRKVTTTAVSRAEFGYSHLDYYSFTQPRASAKSHLLDAYPLLHTNNNNKEILKKSQKVVPDSLQALPFRARCLNRLPFHEKLRHSDSKLTRVEGVFSLDTEDLGLTPSFLCDLEFKYEPMSSTSLRPNRLLHTKSTLEQILVKIMLKWCTACSIAFQNFTLFTVNMHELPVLLSPDPKVVGYRDQQRQNYKHNIIWFAIYFPSFTNTDPYPTGKRSGLGCFFFNLYKIASL